MNVFRHYKHIISIFVLLGIVAVISLKFDAITHFIGTITSALMPLITGAAMAFVIDIIVSRYERWLYPKVEGGWAHKTRRLLAIVLALLTIGLLVSFVARMAIPQLIHSLSLIVTAIPALYEKIVALVSNYVSTIPGSTTSFLSTTMGPDTWAQKASEWGTKGGAYIVDSMGSLMSWVFNIVIGLFFAIYILLDKERLLHQAKRLCSAYCKQSTVGRIYHYTEVAFDTFSKFFIGQFLDALVLGIMVGITLWIFDVSYAMTIACVIGLTGLIPLIGIYVGGVMGAVILLTVNPVEALLYVIILEVIHQVESNLIYPRIVGSSIGLPGIWVFATVIVGGSLYGVIGMLVGVPLVATLYKLLQEDMRMRL